MQEDSLGKELIRLLKETRGAGCHLIAANINQHKTWLNSIDRTDDKQFIAQFDRSKSPATPEVLIVVPVKKRKHHLHKLIECLKPQLEKAVPRVAIVVSEFSDEPEHNKFCDSNGINYCFHKSKVFNKSCAMNQAVSLYPGIPNNILFHDVDIVMDPNWLEDVLKTADKLRKNKGHSWICQTIKDRKVEYVNKSNSQSVFSGAAKLKDLPKMSHDVNRFWFEGRYPPGGSIMVPVELFSTVSGYDSHLYWGYSPEDIAFLENCMFAAGTSVVDVIETDSRSYHLFHDITEKSNASYEFMVSYGKLLRSDIYLRLCSILMKSNVGFIGSIYDKCGKHGVVKQIAFYPCLRAKHDEPFYLAKNSWTHMPDKLKNELDKFNKNTLRIASFLHPNWESNIFISFDEFIDNVKG
mgnify:CR=1 FL=1